MDFIPKHLSSLARFMLQHVGTLTQSLPGTDDLEGLRHQVQSSNASVNRLRRREGKALETEAVRVGGVPCLWTFPRAPRSNQHVLLYLHGGGYVSGSVDDFLGLPYELASSTGLKVLAVDYRLAPEHPFPAALDDILAVITSLLDDGLEARHLAMFGESAGGGLVLSTVHRLRRQDLPEPAALAVLSPWADLTLDGATTHALEASDPFFNLDQLTRWGKTYAGEQPLDDPLVSPLFGDFTDFPPLLVQSGTQEMMLGDALRLARRARSQGSTVQLDVWDGLWHVFQATPNLPEAQEALGEVGRFLLQHVPDLPD